MLYWKCHIRGKLDKVLKEELHSFTGISLLQLLLAIYTLERSHVIVHVV